MNTARTIDSVEVSFNLSFVLYNPIMGWTYFFDSSCSFFVSYVPRISISRARLAVLRYTRHAFSSS